MEHIFEYYTLRLTTKSPVFVGSGQSFDKKDFCLLKKNDKIRLMDMDKLIEYPSQSDRNMELFEKFMLEDKTLAKEKTLSKSGKLYKGTDCLEKKWLNIFLNLIEMPVTQRERCAIYEIDNEGMFQEENTPCEIQRFMRGADGRAYIPGSSVKGMLRTALLQYLIRQNPDKLPYGENIKRTEKDLDSTLINTLALKYKEGVPDTANAVNSIMKGISISDSEPISNDYFTVCKKIDMSPKNKQGEINTARECIKPYEEVIFHMKVDKRYFKPVGITTDTKELFSEMIKSFDNEYRKFYLTKFRNVDFNDTELKNDFLVIGGGSGYFGKNVIYTRYGFQKGLKKVSKYMYEKDLDKDGNPKDKDGKMKNPDDFHNHGISPHMLKLTEYQGEMYHMGICDVDLERETI